MQEERALDHREAEWQFDAVDVRPVGVWLENRSRWDGPAVSAVEVREISDTYFDTGDWRLYRAGYALRVRRSGEKANLEATMKSLASEDRLPGLRLRREISGSAESEEPDSLGQASGPVGEYLRSLAGSATLRPLFTIRTHRSAYTLSLHGESAGEVVLDASEIPLGDGAEPARLRRVEVELDAGSEAFSGLEPFVEELREGCRLSPAGASKFEAALFALGLAPPGPPELGPTAVDASQTIGETAFAVMREQFGEFLAHEPGTRLGDDPEELHDMRVASRRLRAAMSIFEEALPVRARSLREELRWIAGVLGEVRDLDVQLEHLGAWISDADPEDREHLAVLRGVLEERRAKARKAMLRALDSRRYARMVEAFVTLLKRGPSRRSRTARRPVLAVAPDIVRRRYRKVRKAGDGISGESSDEDYHDLRKKGKRLRYALEFLSGVYGKPAEALVEPLKDLQDVVGDHQDAVVAISHLRGLAESGGRRLPPGTVFVMGGIAHRYALRARELRDVFPKVYGRIRGKRWKRLKRAMDDRRPAEEESREGGLD